jgi:hypothetical protein
VASYDPETDTVIPAPDEAQEAEDVDPLAMAKAVDFAGKGSEECQRRTMPAKRPPLTR